MSTALVIVLSACFGALVAVAASRLVEKLGSFGAILATSPSTVVPAVLGVAIALDGDRRKLTEAMFSVPLGQLVTLLYLATWRSVPAAAFLYSGKSNCAAWLTGGLPFDEGKHRRLLIVAFLCTIFMWLGTAAVILFGLKAQIDDVTTSIVLGSCSLTVSIVTGLSAVLCLEVPPKKRPLPVGLGALVARGLLAGTAVGTAVSLSTISGAAAGLASAFPSVTLVTLTSTWFSQGPGITLGVAGPMMLGTSSVPGYALWFCLTDWVMGDASVPVRIVISGSVAYVAALLTCTLPAALIINWRRQRNPSVPLLEQTSFDISRAESDSSIDPTPQTSSSE